MAKPDYYEILGVDKSADSKTLKKAYRRIAMKCHPDRNPGDLKAETKFKEASEAYDVLSDPRKRQQYNQFGHDGLKNNGSEGFSHADVSDIFEGIFGDIFSSNRGRRTNRPRRGSDLQYNLEISLEEAVLGTTKKIRFPSNKTCETCRGSGSTSGRQTRCSHCQGTGQIRMQQSIFSVQQTCSHCRGRGQVIADPCATCLGQGQVKDNRMLSVSIPAGVDTGDRVRMAGEGQRGPDQAGDLFVQVAIRPHSIFKRDGKHLYCEAPVNIVVAALGGELEVPTLDGRVSLKIPPGTQTSKMLRLRGKGISPVRGGTVGDIYCRVLVETPVNLSSHQRELLTAFGTSLKQDKHSPHFSSWLRKVKKFLDDLGR